MTLFIDLATLVLLAVAARLLILYVRNDDFKIVRPQPPVPRCPHPYTLDGGGIPTFDPR